MLVQHPEQNPRKDLGKNLIKLTPTQDRRRLAKLQRVNVDRNLTTYRWNPLLLPTVYNNNRTINWATSIGKNLMWYVLEVAQDVSTTLAQFLGMQLVRTFSLPPSITMTGGSHRQSVQEMKEDGMSYCPICTLMGRECKGRRPTLDWDDTEKKETRDILKWSIVTPVSSSQQPQTYNQSYFDCMINNPTLMSHQKNWRIQELIIAQEELNQPIRSIPLLNLIDEVEWANSNNSKNCHFPLINIFREYYVPIEPDIIIYVIYIYL